MKKTIIASTLALAVLLGGNVSAFAAAPTPAQVVDRVDGAYNKIMNVMNRLNTLSGKLTAHGIDATSLNTALSDVAVKRQAAELALTTFKNDYVAAGNTYNATVKADLVNVKTALTAFKNSAKTARDTAKALATAAKAQ